MNTADAIKSYRSYARKHADSDVRRSARWSEQILRDLAETCEDATPEAIADAVVSYCDHARSK